jgi:hypothetical protein
MGILRKDKDRKEVMKNKEDSLKDGQSIFMKIKKGGQIEKSPKIRFFGNLERFNNGCILSRHQLCAGSGQNPEKTG